MVSSAAPCGRRGSVVHSGWMRGNDDAGIEAHITAMSGEATGICREGKRRRSSRWRSVLVGRSGGCSNNAATFVKRRICWSGRRVSNSRPQPWQGCALPTELLPRGYCCTAKRREYTVISGQGKRTRREGAHGMRHHGPDPMAILGAFAPRLQAALCGCAAMSSAIPSTRCP